LRLAGDIEVEQEKFIRVLWPNSWKWRVCCLLLYLIGIYTFTQVSPALLDSLMFKFVRPVIGESILGNMHGNTYLPKNAIRPNQIIGNPVTQDIITTDTIIKRFPIASTLLEYPEKIRLHDSGVVKLTLGKKEIIQALKSKIKSPQKYVTDITKITGIMSAKLTGSGFDINPPNAVEQAISLETPTEWEWDIEAKNTGKQKLKLELDILIPIGKQNTHKHITTLVRNVEVNVTLLQWAEQGGEQFANFLNNWKDIIGVLLLIFGFMNRNRLFKLLKHFGKDKSQKTKPSTDMDYPE
jgi:hypothetical protein